RLQGPDITERIASGGQDLVRFKRLDLRSEPSCPPMLTECLRPSVGEQIEGLSRLSKER
ncbi:hypothetical protein A2U01_0089372, partial [Trifolium medium]|nr:hypothetical protein [Trifolium medium]